MTPIDENALSFFDASSTRSRRVNRRSLLTGAVAGAISGRFASSPLIVGAQDQDSWTDLLNVTPDPAEWSDEPPTELFTIGDVGLQLESIGLSAPASPEDEAFRQWIAATFNLAFPGAIANVATHPDFMDLLGWNIAQIDQMVESIQLPEGLTIVRGRFDETSVETAWQNQQYQMIEIEGFAVAQLSEEAGFDLGSDLGQFGLGRFNNAVFLDASTIAYTTSQPVMESIIATSLGSVPSILAGEPAGAVVAAIPLPLATGTMVSGAVLGGGQDAPLGRGAGGRNRDGIELALLGQTPGGPLLGPTAVDFEGSDVEPRSIIIMALAYGDASAAEAGLSRALDGIATGVAPSNQRPFTDFFTSWEGFVTDERIVVLELTPAEDPGIWRRMLFRRDLTFLG